VEGSALISVRTQVVLDTLIGSIAQAVAGKAGEPLAAPLEQALAMAGDERRQMLARAGYLTRAVELSQFERAREPMPWLAEQLHARAIEAGSWSEAAAALATELAEAEPSERPEPGDHRAVSWKVPGPGGHVRHYLALRAASDGGGDPQDPEGKRSWLTGFLVHCIAEAAPPVAGVGSG